MRADSSVMNWALTEDVINIDSWAHYKPIKWNCLEKRKKAIRLLKTWDEGDDQFSFLEKTIKDAQYILTLGDDYDGEGSPGYSPETLKRTEAFLKAYAETFFATFNLSLPIPKILPGPDSSIDILWKNDEWELLINFSPDIEIPAAFYGDRKDGLSIKGHLNPSLINPGLLEWLKHQT